MSTNIAAVGSSTPAAPPPHAMVVGGAAVEQGAQIQHFPQHHQQVQPQQQHHQYATTPPYGSPGFAFGGHPAVAAPAALPGASSVAVYYQGAHTPAAPAPYVAATTTTVSMPRPYRLSTGASTPSMPIAVNALGGTAAVTPTGSYVGPQCTARTTVTPSGTFVAAPAQPQTPQLHQVQQPQPQPVPAVMPAVQPPPGPPESLLAGIPDPSSIEMQRSAFSNSLEEQKARGEEALKVQQQEHTKYIYQTAEAQKRQLMLQIDQQAKQQELALSQQFSHQVMSLNQEYQTQKIALEKQANELVMDYHRRKSMEDMNIQQYEIQRKAHDEQARFVQELHQTTRELQNVSSCTPQVVPPPFQGTPVVAPPQAAAEYVPVRSSTPSYVAPATPPYVVHQVPPTLMPQPAAQAPIGRSASFSGNYMVAPPPFQAAPLTMYTQANVV
eukprot:TRINITY_DN3792_c0_g1_i1.p1 TRINITY_DN3792_c0_g1~~TRINITY_DN3792_c0_g1_i1.p1  ORF type:complete len:440 (+),score=77.93 TRINITY_DN3792_c0_g1_i1:52-1371(+)